MDQIRQSWDTGAVPQEQRQQAPPEFAAAGALPASGQRPDPDMASRGFEEAWTRPAPAPPPASLPEGPPQAAQPSGWGGTPMSGAAWNPQPARGSEPVFALPTPATTPRPAGVVFAPRKRHDRRQLAVQVAVVAGFVLLAAVAALVIATAGSRDSAPTPEARITAAPSGGPNPFTGRVDPVPALTENDNLLPAADAAQATPDGAAVATTTTAAPAIAGNQSTSTPTPSTPQTTAPSSTPVPKTVTLTYGVDGNKIVVDGGDAISVNVGDTVRLARKVGDSGAVFIGTDGSGLQQSGGGAFDRTYKAVGPGTFVISITTAGTFKTITVAVN